MVFAPKICHVRYHVLVIENTMVYVTYRHQRKKILLSSFSRILVIQPCDRCANSLLKCFECHISVQ